MAVAVSTPADPASGDSARVGPRKMSAELWNGVDRLVDGAADLSDLRAHRLHLWAARRRRIRGLGVPEDLANEEQGAAVAALAATALLQKVRSAYDGPLIVMKGPEVAARYPDHTLRAFLDIDLLPEDPVAAHRALIAAGFEADGYPETYYEHLHHLRPLHWPGLPLLVELHRRPYWVDWTPTPSREELFSLAVPSSLAVGGLLTFEASAHAVVLAAHSWGRVPLGRLSELVDIAAMLESGDRDEAQALAHRWQLAGMWRTTVHAADSLLYGTPRPACVRLWARHLPAVRETTVFGNHVRRWLSLFSALPPHQALRAASRTLGRELLPAHGETWAEKLARSRLAIRNAFVRRSEHDRALGSEARKLRRRPAARPRS